MRLQKIEIPARADVSVESDMKRLSPAIKKAWERMNELNDLALELVAKAHPDEDVNELVLSKFAFDEDACVRIGYATGDTPARWLYIYMLFNRMEASSHLIY